MGKAGGANGFQRGAVEPVQLRVDAAQHPRVIVVGRHAAQAEQDKAFQAAHVLVRLVPELLHVVVKANAGAGGVDVFGELIDGLRVKIDIGDGGEQPLHQQQGLLRGRGAPLADQLCGVGDQRTGQPILCGSGFGGFTAYPGAPGAGGAVRGLLTLKAKHGFVHTVPPFPAEDTQSMDGPAALYALAWESSPTACRATASDGACESGKAPGDAALKATKKEPCSCEHSS